MTTPPDEQELAACPFCGTDVIVATNWESARGASFWFCKCIHCDCQTDRYCRSERQAVEVWNQRAPNPEFASLRAEVARLREALSPGARDVLAERRRQIEVEGWTPDHDDEHADGALAHAAACYAVSNNRLAVSGPTRVGHGWSHIWPWAAQWWKPKDRRSDLVRAAALILAEIERLDRSALASLTDPEKEG